MAFDDDSRSRILTNLYLDQRISIRQAAALTGLSYRAVRLQLLKLGILRTISEGMTLFPRCAFSGDNMERAYLLGLRAGDINGWRKSPNTIEVRVSTTHPAMAGLFVESFGKYGHIMKSAERAFLPNHYMWQIKAHLDPSFDFLVSKPVQIPANLEEFYRFLAGYSDCEANWAIYSQGGHVRTAWVIETKDRLLMGQISERLGSLGFHPLRYDQESEDHSGREDHGNAGSPKRKIRIVLCRKDEVAQLARTLLPISHHSEKVFRMKLIVGHRTRSWRSDVKKVKNVKRMIKVLVQEFVRQAERAYNTRI